jgi:hypothetical protein
MKLELQPIQIAYPRGLEISVEGFSGEMSHERPSQVYIEVYEGKLRVHVWRRDSEDPEASIEIRPQPAPVNAASDPTAPSCNDGLQNVLLTLQYCLETLEQNCQCGRCDPCTRGRSDIRKAIRDVEDSIFSSKCLPSHS